MKTKFFKKLSFVLVVAMVLSLLVPAAGAFAAAAPKLNSTKKYLHLGRDDANEFNFNINNKQKGWQYYWESNDEEVVVVNEKNGVVNAVGVGKAKVTVYITDADDEEVDELTATVTVRDNIEEVAIKNPVEGTLAVGAPHDFDRSFVTESGSTKMTSGITRWIIDPDEGATIDEKGVFVATEAGEYNVTAVSFQSKAKYEAWLLDGDEDLVTAESEPSKVVVGLSMLDVEQIDTSSVLVTFDSDVSEVVNKDNLDIFQVIGSAATRVPQLIKEIKFSDDGKKATVSFFVDFTSEANYLVIYNEKEIGFQAAKIDVLEVASVELAFDTMVYTEAPKKLSAVLKNDKGVDITTETLLANVEYVLKEDSKGYIVVNSGDYDLYLFDKGEIAIVEMIFHTYKYKEDPIEEIVVRGLGTVAAIEATEVSLGAATEFSLSDGNPADIDWKKPVTSLAAGDTGYSVYTRIKKSDDSYLQSWDADSKITFSSSDDSVLVVDTYGTIYPVKQGNAVIISYYDGVARATMPVTILGQRAVTTFAPDKTSVTITNSTNVKATDKFAVTIQDQLQKDWDAVSFTVEELQGNPTGVSPVEVKTYTSKDIDVVGDGAGAGTWRYLVKGYDRQFMLTVIVQEPTSDLEADVKIWRLSLDKTTVDLAAADKDVVKTITPTLMGYAQNGIASFKADLTGADYYYTIGEDLQATASIEVTSVSGGALSVDISKGAYIVTAYEVDADGDILRGTARFTVTDSTPPATSVLENTTTSKTTVLEAVKDAFKVVFRGEDVEDTDLFEVTYVVGGEEKVDTANNDTTSAGNLFIKSVKFTKSYDSDSVHGNVNVVYTANIGRTIVVK